MPAGLAPLTAADCYRFVLASLHIHVAVCGPKNDDEMGHALAALEQGPLDEEELSRMRAIGRHVHEQKSMADWFR